MMLSLANVRDYIKTIFVADNYYIGKLDNKKDKSIGIYNLKSSRKPNIALGGLENTSYAVKSVSILIHWNKNVNDTEKAGMELYNALLCKKNFDIGDKHINYIEMLVDNPVDVGTDDKNVYEMVIQCNFYYKR